MEAAAQLQAQGLLDQRTAGMDAGLAAVAELVVLVEGGFGLHRATPLVAHLARDDIDDSAHGIGAVEGRHGSADHLDALDRRDRREEAGGGLAEAVGGDAAGGILAAAVDQHQGVVAGHAADADVASTGLAHLAAHVDALHAAQGIGEAGHALLLQLFPADHRDAGRGFGHGLFEAGGGDHDVVQPRVILGQGGQGRGDGGQGHRADQGMGREAFHGNP